MAARELWWDGNLWTVERGEHAWTLSAPARKGQMYGPKHVVRLADAPTFEDIAPWLEAQALAKLAPKARTGQQTVEEAYQATKAIIGALDRGMPVEQIEAALEGRPHKPGKQVMRCPRCRTSGYAGSYPFSTGYGSGLCDDCGG